MAIVPQEPLILERDNDRVTVRLNRPAKHNGMNLAMLDAVNETAHSLARDRQLRSVIIEGAGPSFCAGLDFKSVFDSPLAAAPAMAQLWLPYANRFQRWSLAWRDLGVPVVAAIHGNCFGAGLQLALGADIRVARADAQFSVMEAKWGLVPDMGGVALLRELMPIDRAKQLTLSAQIIDGIEAERIGLITHLADDPKTMADEIAGQMSRYSPDAAAAGKFLLQDAWQASEKQATSAERKYQRRLIGRINQRISMARNDKRPDKPFHKRHIDR